MSTQVSRAGQGTPDTHFPGARPRSSGATTEAATPIAELSPPRSRRGQSRRDTQSRVAAAPSIRAGQPAADTHSLSARPPIGEEAISFASPKTEAPLATGTEEGAGQPRGDTQTRSARPLPALLGQLREHYRQRCDHHSAEKRLTLQIKAISRRLGGPKGSGGLAYSKWFQATAEKYPAFLGCVFLLEECRSMLEKHRKAEEKTVEKLAQELPVWPWAEKIRGVGALALGQIIAETGDLSDYSNPAKVWKRMGVGMFQTQAGEWSRQRKAAGADGVAAGYAPRRAAVIFNVSECLIKLNQDGPYRTLYDERKAFEATKPACAHALCQKVGDRCRPGHLHNRARRYMAKRFLRNLWREWNRVAGHQACDTHSLFARHPADQT